jgi:hypothetical protein
MAVKQAQAAPVAPSTRFTDIDLPGRLESLLLTCLDKDPSNRPVAVDDVAHSLRQSGIGDAWTQARARDWWKTHG